MQTWRRGGGGDIADTGARKRFTLTKKLFNLVILKINMLNDL